MTYYELINDAEHKLNLNKITLGEYEEMIKPLKKEIEQQPCEDCISRDDVLALAEKGTLVSNGNYTSVCKAINELPSVTPKGVTITDFADRCRECGRIKPCEDCISRKSIKQKLQEHHDFFVDAYGGFSNLPQNDKSRVDEITNCIAMVVNEPSVTPKAESEERND
jgi:hypothetical protein